MGDERTMVRRRTGIDTPHDERDPDLPCPSDDFEPGTPEGECETDGHYMCRECVNADPTALEERDTEVIRG